MDKQPETAIKFREDYPRISLITLLFFCGYVIIWYLQIGYRIPILGAIRFEFIYGIFLTVIAISYKTNFKVPLISFLLLYFFTLLIQIPFSYDFNTSWNIFRDRVVKFSFLAFFIAVFVKRPRDLLFFLGAFMLACMKMGQEGFIGNITGSMIWENQGVMRLHGPTPLYGHPNSFSGNALGTLPFIYYFIPITPLFVQIALFIQLIFAINIILFTGSRTGYIAFVAFLLYAFYNSANKKRLLIITIVLSFITIPLIPKDYKDRFNSIFTGEEKEGKSMETRIQILEDALDIFLDHPLGVGVSAFPAIRRDTFGRSQDTHNLYLEVATNLGIQGFITFFLFVYMMMKTLQNLKNSFFQQKTAISEMLLSTNLNFSEESMIEINRHQKELSLMEASSKAVNMFIIIRLALGLFGMDLYEIYWWFALGITISLYNMNTISLEKTYDIQRFIESSNFLIKMNTDIKTGNSL